MRCPQGCTLVSFGTARSAGLVHASGTPVGTFGRVSYIEVRGVVAGAAERVPTLRLTCACTPLALLYLMPVALL